MRTIVTGIIVFILWSILCTWYYLNYIKGPAKDETTLTEESVSEMAPVEDDTLTEAVEPEPSVEKPASFTVYHEFNRSEIINDADFDNFIERVILYRKQTPESRLNVVGHTDNIGSEDYNYRLGIRRARSTLDYLVKMGISAQIVTTSSEGELSPVATNETDSGRAKNRRTEIKVIE